MKNIPDLHPVSTYIRCMGDAPTIAGISDRFSTPARLCSMQNNTKWVPSSPASVYIYMVFIFPGDPGALNPHFLKFNPKIIWCNIFTASSKIKIEFC